MELIAIIDLLYKYKYFLLFPLAIVEGPVLAVITGFLYANKFLNVFIAYPIIVLGDIIGDSLCYMLGRFGAPEFLKKIIKKVGFNPEKIDAARSYFNNNSIMSVALSKITLGIGFAGIYLAGNAKIPYKKFILICLVTSALQYVVYLSIGYLFGSAYEKIARYIDFLSALIIVIVITILLFIFLKSYRKKK
ncbi:MAG: VTT domain-containing protein [Bacteroidota bacterium]|nr:VTT domain-containing protein [Bacteroidota bacterium]